MRKALRPCQFLLFVVSLVPHTATHQKPGTDRNQHTCDEHLRNDDEEEHRELEPVRKGEETQDGEHL